MIKRIHSTVLTVLAVSCMLTLLWLQPAWGSPPVWLWLAVAIVYAVADSYSVSLRIPGWASADIHDATQPREVHINVSEAPFIFALLVLGPTGVLPLLIATTVVTRLVRRRWWIEVLFNTTHLIISYALALCILSVMGAWGPALLVTTAGAVGVFVVLVLIPLWDAWTFSVLIAVRSGHPYRQVLADIFGLEVLIALVPLAMGTLAAVAWEVNPPLLALALVPVVLAHRALAAVARWADEHATVRALARELHQTNATLDARVQERTAEVERLHSHWVAETTEAMHDARHRVSALETALELVELSVPATVQQRPLFAQAHARVEQSLAALYTYLAMVLDAVCLQSGELKLAPTVLDAAELLVSTQNQLTARFQGLACQWEVALPPEPLLVVGDRTRLERVYFNLLDNAATYAADYASTVGAQARVSIWFSAKDGSIGCHVCDNGPGLTPDQVEQLGARGVRLSADPRRVEGNGLGLSFCFRAVGRMGGQLVVDSPGPGQGSTFTLWLPSAARPALAATNGVCDIDALPSTTGEKGTDR